MVDVSSKTEVRDLHYVVLRHQDVPGGQVPVDALWGPEGKRDWGVGGGGRRGESAAAGGPTSLTGPHVPHPSAL